MMLEKRPIGMCAWIWVSSSWHCVTQGHSLKIIAEAIAMRCDTTAELNLFHSHTSSSYTSSTGSISLFKWQDDYTFMLCGSVVTLVDNAVICSLFAFLRETWSGRVRAVAKTLYTEYTRALRCLLTYCKCYVPHHRKIITHYQKKIITWKL
jgi:hypothetical protein